MPDVYACPHCQGSILLPKNAQPDDSVECPLCSAAFTVSAARAAQLVEARILPKPEAAAQEVPPSAAPEPHAPETIPSTEKPTIETSAGTLSDWLNREGAAEQTTDPSQTIQEPSPEEGLASLESLLNSFRGEDAPPTAAQETPEATPKPVEAAEPSFNSKATVAGFEAGQELSEEAQRESAPGLLEAAVSPPAQPDATPSAVPATEPTDSDEAEAPAASGEPLAKDFRFDFAEQSPPAPKSEGVRLLARERRQKPRAPRASLLKPAVVLTSAAVGVGVGYLAMLWVGGPSSDRLGVAQVLPQVLLPASFDQDPAEPCPLPEETLAAEASPKPSLVEQATFEEVVENPIGADELSKGSLLDEMIDEPAPLLEPRDAPTVTGLINPPAVFTQEELRQASAGAESARALLSEQGLGANPDAAAELGAAYARLCGLAHTLTFLDEAEGDRDLERLAAQEVFQRLFQYDHARRDARDMATRWLAWEGRPHGGVFFAGQIISSQQREGVYYHEVRLSNNERVLVLSTRPFRPMNVVAAKQMGVVGSVLDSPEEHVPGYRSRAQHVVWACHTVSLGKARFD